jgi:hypothetical protein
MSPPSTCRVSETLAEIIRTVAIVWPDAEMRTDDGWLMFLIVGSPTSFERFFSVDISPDALWIVVSTLSRQREFKTNLEHLHDALTSIREKGEP